MAQIELNNLTFSYPGAPSLALNSVSLSIEKGQFIVLFGPSGSGKSTLLRLLKEEVMPHGELSGKVYIEKSNPEKIGFVFQDPENQIVADDPLHELVFGLENIGMPTNEMRSRAAEIVSFFGAEPLLHKKMQELSGGKKQQMNLASVLLMQPDILLLDEPTSQLDPVSTRELLDMLARLNEEFGMTVIMAEHRLDEVVTLADKMIMLEGGRVSLEGPARQVMKKLWDSEARAFVPKIPGLFLGLAHIEPTTELPLSIKEGRKKLPMLGVSKEIAQEDVEPGAGVIPEKNEMLFAKNLSFRYENKNGTVLDELSVSLHQGEIYALLGGNGSGKSTLLKLLCGILKPESGKVMFSGKPLKKWKGIDLARKIAYLPQNPKLFFLHDTVGEELEAACRQWATEAAWAASLIQKFGINDLLGRHPYDLSGGELQKAALACLLLRKPDFLLLDEPTKGLDPLSKDLFASILKELKDNGVGVLISTHDIEFAAAHATRCGMLFSGSITSEGNPEQFFKGNFFYTTMEQRLFRGLRVNN